MHIAPGPGLEGVPKAHPTPCQAPTLTLLQREGLALGWLIQGIQPPPHTLHVGGSRLHLCRMVCLVSGLLFFLPLGPGIQVAPILVPNLPVSLCELLDLLQMPPLGIRTQ